MSTERRIRASQQNGARSRGPKTAEGKRRSSRNAIRHGLLSNTVVLEDEDGFAFRKLLRALEDEFLPQTPNESALVENLAIARWRLMRVWALEKESLNLQIQKHDPDAYNPAERAALAFRSLSDGSRSLVNLNRYEALLDRQYHRALSLLLNCRENERLPNEPTPISGQLTPQQPRSPAEREGTAAEVRGASIDQPASRDCFRLSFAPEPIASHDEAASPRQHRASADHCAGDPLPAGAPRPAPRSDRPVEASVVSHPRSRPAHSIQPPGGTVRSETDPCDERIARGHATFRHLQGLYSELSMQFVRWATGLALLSAIAFAATFGTVVPVIGGAADLVLDEGRGRLYLVNTSQNRVEIYSIQQRRLLTPVTTDRTPLSAAISRSGKFLYVAVRDASALDVIDLDLLAITRRVALPAQPEAVAVGADERVLVSTIGSGNGNAANVLLLFDPGADGPTALVTVPITPPAPQPPALPAPNGRQFLATRSQLTATPDGNTIIGVNLTNGATRIVFVFEVASGTMLRSRAVSNPSTVLAVAPDGSKFMSGSTLFDAATLQVLAQENLANAPYLVQPGTNFNTQTNQGGSAFAPDGSVIYAGFDISPQTNPATRPNISELMINDPDNLLIQTALEMPENLAGKMVIASDGGTLFALSDSGFLVVPLSTMSQNPIAVPESTVLLLQNDQCGVTAALRTASVNVRNAGRGRMTASAQVLQLTPTGPLGLGGNGPGGGIVGGGGIIIILPPIIGGGVTPFPGPVIPGGNGGATNQAIFQNAPAVRATQNGNGASLDFSFNSNAARALGTISPSHDFVVQSPEAINIPARVRVYQNNHDAEARGDIIPVPVGISANEALMDMVYDSTRQRIYIANSGMNRVEVFDTRQKAFLDPIKVGQLPHSIAMTPDGGTLYVANSGGENISIVDLDKMQLTGRVKFPPVPLFLNSAISTPGVIAAGLRGPLFLMSVSNAAGTASTDTIWQIVGDQAVPRPASAIIGTTATGAPRTITGPSTMAATPGGEFVVLAGTDGNIYLYDAMADDFVQSRTLTSINQSRGYFGPITAGPRGQYYVMNGTILNSALTALNPAAPATGGTAATTRPVAAVSASGATTFARFTQPLRTNANQLPSDAGQIEIVDINTQATLRTVAALEGPMSQATATGRPTVVSGRTMAVDPSGSTAYVLTTAGLSVVPLDTVNAQSRPQVNPKGAVNLASYQSAVAQNGLLSIFGTNLGASAVASSMPLPRLLGGVCVTLSNNPLPLFMTSPGQINAQIPPELASGNYSLVVRAVDRNLSTASQTVAVSKYAPAVFVDANGQSAILHADGRFVTKDHPAHRDEPLVLYAAGLGLTTGGKVTGGAASPSSPLAVTAKVQVYFGDPRYSQSGIIVDWSGLAPGFVGLYQLNLRIPGDHMKGDALPVTLKINNVSSPSSGPVVPTIAVE